jgi:peptidylprolyl isomerase
MLPNVTDKVWMKIEIDGTNVGQIEFGLFGTNSPAAVENFLSLVKCNHGAIGKLSGKSLCYKGSAIHRVIPNFAFQGGDITHGDGTGGESMHGGRMSLKEDQKEQIIKFTRPKLLANAGLNMEFGSQFFVTTVKTQWITGKHVAFGRVLNDPDGVITKIEEVGTYGGKTKAKIKIFDTGVGTLTEADKKPHY